MGGVRENMNSSYRGELLFHWAFLGLSLIVIAISFVLRADDQRGILVPGTGNSLPAMCSSRMMFGIECPGCGMTRAFLAISQGRWSRAWELNRVSFLVYAFVLGQIPWHAVQIFRIRRGWPPLYWFAIYFIPMGLAILLTVNWIFKLAGW